MKINFSEFCVHDIDGKEIFLGENDSIPLYQLILRNVFYDFTAEDPIELPKLISEAYSGKEIDLTTKHAEVLKKTVKDNKQLTNFLKREFLEFIDKH